MASSQSWKGGKAHGLLSAWWEGFLMAQMCGEYQQEWWASGKNKMLDVCSMENCTDVNDRELVVTQAQIRRSYPLDRVNGNSKKCSDFLFFPFTKCMSSMVSWSLSLLWLLSIKRILNINDSLLISAPREVFLSSALCPLNTWLDLFSLLSQAWETVEVHQHSQVNRISVDL